MSKKFKEYKKLDLSQVNNDILNYWHEHDTFRKSLKIREGSPNFIFYEGPPSANGMPGIHHVMARSIKDIFCRYKTMKGFLVDRKAGWDTHGLPVELGVEKALGITKEDIGKTISIADYNKACRKDVMKYTDLWEELTEKMGYWVDMHDPYITYDNRYIETLWWLLKQLYEKGLLYKGYTIQPYSPAAGTGLSTHELNQPGCYRDVKDTTAVVQFRLKRDDFSESKFFSPIASDKNFKDISFLAWTTTPWTLPSNTALAAGRNIEYLLVKTIQPYALTPTCVILARDLFSKYFYTESDDIKIGDSNDIISGFRNEISWDHDFTTANIAIKLKIAQWEIVTSYRGSELEGTNYEQLIPWVNPGEGAFRVILGDFVTTEEGTGIVHIAPTFGADDDRVAKASGVPPLLMFDKDDKRQPMVDRTGKFFLIEDLDPIFVSENVNTEKYKEFAGRFVKNAYDSSLTEKDTTLDVDLCVMLKQQDKAFKIEKHTHNYPHCWRTDKPVLYYPLDSWFIKTTAMKDRMIELNNTINWKPESTGTGRFGKWLENLLDWNLSRSRFWGTPLPIWRTEDGSEETCIGSVNDLKLEIEKSVKAGLMSKNPLSDFISGNNSKENYELFDLHRPFVDEIILVSPSGKKMIRETDLIDVWFDSGAMPYAQIHYPFNGKLEGVFPADFIAEGVDQTRGWFFTLHAIAAMLFDSVAFQNIISNGLVLDKNGNKMSKRLGNGVDPFETIKKYGSDPLRWYMITNASPWDNLKFDVAGIDEITRKFFGTLYNTYNFFALYANVDGFIGKEPEVPVKDRPEIDRWIISLLNSLIQEVDNCYHDYEPTRAGRAIQDFVTENLSNWYVRLNRKRFWGGEMDTDKLAAYQTLYTCLVTVAKLSSPIAPFYMDQLYIDLNGISGTELAESVHLADFPKSNSAFIDKDLEEKMDLAQKISSMVLALRRKVNIKVRQPLQKIMIPILDKTTADKIEAVKKLILTEVNVKEFEYIEDTLGILVKKIKPNFKTLGPKYGKHMKGISAEIAKFSQQDIAALERQGHWSLNIDGSEVELTLDDVEIMSEDIPGLLVATEGKLTVALDITLTNELLQEGIARELINRIQNLRKESGFDVTDKISIEIQKHKSIYEAIKNHENYIATQTLAKRIEWVDNFYGNDAKEIEFDDEVKTLLKIARIE
jgi:isoleucyl-tRNA synthetase